MTALKWFPALVTGDIGLLRRPQAGRLLGAYLFLFIFPEKKFRKYVYICTSPEKKMVLRCQVSVLKQALAEGEEVDVQDEKGLTALMWAARAGRLSTAKYLVAQGASLTRTDVATGFSPLHFAAYYCRCVYIYIYGSTADEGEGS